MTEQLHEDIHAIAARLEREVVRLRGHRAELRAWLANLHDAEMDAGGKWTVNDYASVTNFLDEQDRRPRGKQ